MQFDTVYTKTAKGILETKTAPLPRDLNQVFRLIDGKATIDQLATKSRIAADKLQKIMEKLAADGYVKQIGGTTPAPQKSEEELDLDFTRPEAIAALNAQAATLSLAEADANARAREEHRQALEAKLKQEAEARARALAEMRAQAEADARAKAQAAADAAVAEREEAQQALADARDPGARAEAEARIRAAAGAIARAEAEARVRAEAEERARQLADIKREAEENARFEAEAREKAESMALAKAAEEARARAALEAQIRDLQSGTQDPSWAPPPLAMPEIDTTAIDSIPMRQPQRVEPLPQLIDPLEQAHQDARLRRAAEADEREGGSLDARGVEGLAPASVPNADELQARVQAERRSREEARKVQGDRALGTHAAMPEKPPDVDFEISPVQHAAPLRPPPAFGPDANKPSAGLARAMKEAAARITGAESTPTEIVEIEEEKPAEAPDVAPAQRAAEERPAEERAAADRAAFDVLAEQRARERAAAVDASRAAERARRLEEEARRQAVFDKLRRRRAIIRNASIGAAILIVGAATILQFVPLGTLARTMEQKLGARVGDSVTIGSARYPLLPRPRVLLESVTIGKSGFVKIDQLSIPGLPFGLDVYGTMLARGVTVDPAALGAIATWSGKADAGLRMTLLQLKAVKITPASVDLGAFDGEVEFGDDGSTRVATFKNENATLTLTPVKNQVRVGLSAHDWHLPIGPAVNFTYLDLSGTADRTQLLINDVQGRVAGGTVTGTVAAKWSSPLSVEGAFKTENVRLQEVMPAFTPLFAVGGLLKASGRYALQANSVESLFSAPQVDATFAIARGELGTIDLVRSVQASTGSSFRGGRTPFDELTGAVRVSGSRYGYRDLTLTSGALNASGNAEVGPNGELSGHLQAEVGSKGRVVARSGVTLSGTLKTPVIKLQ